MFSVNVNSYRWQVLHLVYGKRQVHDPEILLADSTQLLLPLQTKWRVSAVRERGQDRSGRTGEIPPVRSTKSVQWRCDPAFINVCLYLYVCVTVAKISIH